MKNYLDQQQELKIAIERIKTLKEKKKIYFEQTQPKASGMKEVVVTNSTTSDMFYEYIKKTEAIDVEIAILEQEIALLKKTLRKMEKSLRKMNDRLTRVFILRYIEGLTVREISLKTNYSESHVYRILTNIRKILKNDKK